MITWSGKLNHIISIGAEVECGIDEAGYVKFKEFSKMRKSNIEIKNDGSVRVEGKSFADKEICFWSDSKREFYRTAKILYQCGIGVNNTCGCHIHLKFKNLKNAANMITFQSVWSSFRKRYREWAQQQDAKYRTDRYARRMKNSYCEISYSRTKMLKMVRQDWNGNRYKMLNLNSLARHETIEIRILPGAETYNEFRENVQWVIETLEEILTTKNIKYEKVKLEKGMKDENLDGTVVVVSKDVPDWEEKIVVTDVDKVLEAV